MNHSFKSVWNQSLGAWVAASETTHRRGKTGSSRAMASAALVLGIALVASGARAQPAMTGNNQGFSIGSATTSGGLCIAIGASGSFSATASCSGADSLAIGNGAAATAQAASAFGVGAAASGAGATALGFGAQALQAGAVALGQGAVTAAAVATPNAVINGNTYTFAGIAPASVVSVGAVGAERTITNVAAGRLSDTSTDAVNGSQLHATNTELTSVGTQVNNIVNNGAGIKYFHVNSAGADAQAVGGESVAIGSAASAQNTGTVAIGWEAAATGTGTYGMAMGYQASTTSNNGMAFGVNASTTGDNGVALGHMANAAGGSGTAVGFGASAAGTGGVAMGTATSASNTNSVAIGTLAKATGSKSIAIGCSRRRLARAA